MEEKYIYHSQRRLLRSIWTTWRCQGHLAVHVPKGLQGPRSSSTGGTSWRTGWTGDVSSPAAGAGSHAVVDQVLRRIHNDHVLKPNSRKYLTVT